MTFEKWLIHPGENRVIDVDGVRTLKVGLVGGQVDVIGHDEPGVRVEVHGVTVKDLRIETSGDALEIDHAQLRWDNVLQSFRNFGAGGPKAEISIAVPRDVALTLGVVSASALVAGLQNGARLNTVSGDVIVDGMIGDVSVNAVSGDTQIRGLVGGLSANSVSGDIAASGALRKADVDTVSGATMIDATGEADTISINTVAGAATVRLDPGLPANFAIRSVSGTVMVDGVTHSGGSGVGVNYTGSVGELSGSFVDLRAHSVSGAVTVLRRAEVAPAEAATPVAEARPDAVTTMPPAEQRPDAAAAAPVTDARPDGGAATEEQW
ncbi:DUF4097 domain-containing protein [Microbacterium sp. zg.Y1090]|uniref:DUF4097 domain-containing protein n=1 Tax=Microbacterium TaxID=33882 RepID=UPI00214C7555|nr:MULTISPECIES: DUF4097 domain-containing protein [unclassified Microbacterium]MCR2813120.1 DUF4097 domain-containing protein [Microbacterium sp. zg.Y1084]MCR2819433.1 DUF4097 domain-containing protein [Microbacterium sp. zg.Y1090]MDL5487022.1 DUF4097 domain-containing protein [Microbacterium sp. zg-Y1211]WIM28410.1 DUF4097 domain-containing protein [Microbacterium sp. zg-Y1090]